MNLNLSVLTSFCATGLKPLLSTNSGWPIEKTPYVELYAFMKEDIQWVFNANGNESTLEILNPDISDPAEAAARISAAFSNQKIIALTSFLPEIMGSDSVALLAEQALIFLVDIVAQLRALNHPVAVLELVAGSATTGVFIGNPNEDPALAPRSYTLMRIDETEAMGTFLKRTKRLAHHAADKDVTLAIELEPGPLFLIKTLESLRNFCSLLDYAGTPSQKDYIGFNLDIPHWAFLSGITTRDLRNARNSNVARRIVHTHISDHSKGHFCDRPPSSDPQRLQDYLEWIEFVGELGDTKRAGNLKHSRAISLELECCSSLHDIHESVAYFAKLIHQ